MYELKWDGFRCVAVRDERGARLWSRQGKELTSQFDDVAAAVAAQVPAGTVLDGELVMWNGSRLNFDLLLRRLLSRTPARTRVGPAASYVVFDLLALEGRDLRELAARARRDVLETVAASWVPPLQLCPMTMDEVVARSWFVDYRPAGIEGLVVKPAAGRYRPGRHSDGWVKVKGRKTSEVIVGAVIGPLGRPHSVVVGLDVAGVLRVVGQSVPLSRAQAATLAAVLEPAGADHPWPDEISSRRFGSGRDKAVLTTVKPVVVVEILADTALQGGAFRHPVRLVRLRPDLGIGDVSRTGT
ncbi:ATP-dependent DNA ligase [Terrabacter sp. MAHUQ-38]|uniref:ATP-dependent DNA ligase n=1 Tax=unclassified Terrabacter TaxID=2630222 RepID=UPI00165D527C|nr:ATP-dependent DNA ligase [Terrabacter sp. MAHUQ-38]MBC9819703.1 ATP-dependent DNA ligase [Terrabacter sp. MAHUQ-38]